MKSLNGYISAALISIFLLFTMAPIQAGDIYTDSLALIALYDSTDGDNWDDNTGWKTGYVDTWYGIELEEGRVVNIYLQGNNLIGNIPPAIGDIDSLQRIYLNGNSGLTDSLPPELGNLKKLDRLYIYSCNLIGSIPPELGNMESITGIALDRNALTGSIPSTFENLNELRYLSLHHNSLTGTIPPEIGNIESLGELYLNENSLTGTIPATLGNLSNLAYIYLQNNELTGSIPPELGNLSNLYSLNLAYNLLNGGIPNEIESLTSLRTLDLSGNNLGGIIPPELGNISNLQHLYLNDCQLIGNIPNELYNLTDLITIIISNNELTGGISSQIGYLTNLVTLNLVNNQLSEEIPPELGNLSNLQQLSLSTNDLNGTIPPELGDLSNLIYLELYGNKLMGNIPSELGDMTNLINFILSENQLTGNIPASLGNLSNVSLFFVQNNELTGPVPEELANLTNVTNLHLVNNDLEDLPDLSGLSFLTNFDVYNNKFTFGDLEPNIHVLDEYSPQDSIATIDTVYYTVNDTLQFEMQTDGLYNNYQWKFNGGDISESDLYSGTNDSVLLIRNPSSADEGVYSCAVTNDSVIDLTLFRYPIYLLPTVKVTDIPEGIHCSNDVIEIGYKSAEISPDNVFNVELSDSLGGFNDPTIIGSLSTTNSIGTIEVNIPEGASTSDQYRLRINASSPLITGVPSTGVLNILSGLNSNPIVTPMTDSSICTNELAILSTDSISGLHFQWYRDDIAIEGAIRSYYEVREAGIYHVEIYNSCSTDFLPSNMVNITIDPLPVIYLEMDGTLLTATYDPDYSYYWHRNEVYIAVDNSQYEYNAVENGEYWVLVEDENGCTNISNAQTVIGITGFENIQHNLDIFPNPTDGRIYIISEKDIKTNRITITSVTGKTVCDKEFNAQNQDGNIEFDISNLLPGIYFVHIESGQSSHYFKLIKR
ncbi:MAG: T9SS type A sorting domain-containing protein [Bacteroidales bacterium]|nr:T9SS type A sorting domain-containing protein [Bacteroidales bacterium]